MAFLNPIALLALLALPALYFLLRITPPAPKTVGFPAIRLLAGLEPKENTPSHTPWWILLLRMVMAALLLMALAKPVLNPSSTPAVSGPLLLIIDNGWAAAPHWNDIQNTALGEIKRAGRQGQVIRIFATAPDAQSNSPQMSGPLVQSDATAMIRGLTPHPWESDLTVSSEIANDFEGQTIWLSDGTQRPSAKAIVEIADTIYAPETLPRILKTPDDFSAVLNIEIDGADNDSREARIQLLDEAGQVLDEQVVDSRDDDWPRIVEFQTPPTLSAQASAFKVAGEQSAATRYNLDFSGGPKSIGIVAPEDAAQTGAFTEDSFYLTKALEPYASITQGSVEDILDTKPSVIILPDIGSMPSETLNALDEWVKAGGLLLRFAGPNMTQSQRDDTLTPMKLRRDARNVQGSLSWDKPLKIAPIAPDSPLYGLRVDEDIEVAGQILPEFPNALDDKVWVSLEDGTPLISAAPHEAGLIVMVHTTASPAWSSYPLSGFYLQSLRRIISFAGRSTASITNQTGSLQPLRVMDGFGNLIAPPPSVKPIDAQLIDDWEPSPSHPPGFYGRGSVQRALNLGDHMSDIRTLPQSRKIQQYGQSFETDLTPHFMFVAFILLLIDGVIMLCLSGVLFTRMRQAACIAAALILAALPAHAQSSSPSDDLYLAYIRSGNPVVDATTQKGLEVLRAALNIRTSAEPVGVRGVDAARDDLVFHPLLYWPISADQAAPSADALRNLQNYIDHGGTILVDTRNGQIAPETVRRILGSLDIPPLREIPDAHVLNKSFYLLDDITGRFEDGAFWVEGQSAAGRDGVSSVILGSQDWVGHWAELNIISRGDRQFIQGLTRGHEMSLRFGINLVMYALTGNYKADQVHVPAILERLGDDNRGAGGRR